jgi:carboxylesterase
MDREQAVFTLLRPLDLGLGLTKNVMERTRLYGPFKQGLYETVRTALRRNFEAHNNLRIEGLENIPVSGGAVLASNHQSWLDVQVLVASCPRHVHFMAKTEFADWPVLRHLIDLSDSVFVNREGDPEALSNAAERLKEGWLVAIYPEGTIPGEEDLPRSAVERVTGLLKGKSGGVRLAVEADVPIIPVGVSGTGKSFPPEVYPRLELLRMPAPGPITIRFGEPISYTAGRDRKPDRQAVRKLTDELMKRISALVDHDMGYVPLSVPRPARPKFDRLGVLLLHGFTSALATVDGLVPHIERSSIPFRMPVLRGHGTRFQDMKGVTAADWYEDAERALLDLHGSGEVDRVVVVGLSMGGLVALELGMEHPDKIAGVATVAAALRFRDPLAGFSPVLARFVDYWTSPNAFNDMSLKHKSRNYPKFATDAFVSLYRYSKRIEAALPQLKVPVRIIQSKKDQVVDPVSANLVYEGVSSEFREISWYHRSGHEMMQDMEAEAVFGDLMEFVQSFRKDGKVD